MHTLTDGERDILNEIAQDCDPSYCHWCHGSGYIADPNDPDEVVPCDACAPDDTSVHTFHTSVDTEGVDLADIPF